VAERGSAEKRSSSSTIQVQRVCSGLAELAFDMLFNDPNLHFVHMQEAGGEIYQYSFAPR
jgi:hypothetical protein